MNDEEKEEIRKAVNDAIGNIKKGDLMDADLNNDGKVSNTEKFIYDLFRTVTNNLQKGSLWTIGIMAVFFLVSLILSACGIGI